MDATWARQCAQPGDAQPGRPSLSTRTIRITVVRPNHPIGLARVERMSSYTTYGRSDTPVSPARSCSVAGPFQPSLRPQVLEQPLARRRGVAEHRGSCVIPLRNDRVRRAANRSSDSSRRPKIRGVAARLWVVAEQDVVLRLTPPPHPPSIAAARSPVGPGRLAALGRDRESGTGAGADRKRATPFARRLHFNPGSGPNRGLIGHVARFGGQLSFRGSHCRTGGRRRTRVGMQ